MEAIAIKRTNRRLDRPSVNAQKLGVIEIGTIIEIDHEVSGDRIEGNEKWFLTTEGFYVWSGGLHIVKATEYVTTQSDFSQLINYNQLIHEISDPVKKTSGRNINIAVLDTGINQKHPDLELKFPSIDFSNSNIGFDDRNGHGSHVAGLISARSKNSTGIIGIAPSCNIQNLKVLLDSGDSVGDNLIKALNHIMNNQSSDVIDIVNLSLNITVAEYIEAVALIESLAEKSLLVAAAGENNKLLISQSPYLPAFSSKVISVGAIDTYFFISHPNAIFNHRIDYLLPNLSLFSCSSEEHNEYFELKGSSMATALVSGIIALVLSYTNKKGTGELNYIRSELDKIAIPYSKVEDINKLQLIKPKYQ